MSSDDYFDDSAQLDSAFLAELDAIEAVHTTATQPFSSTISLNNAKLILQSSALPISSSLTHSTSPISPKQATFSKPQPVPIDVDADESYDQFFDDIDPTELERLDKDVEEAFKDSPSISRTRTSSGLGLTRQLTLYGDVLEPGPLRQRSTQQKHSKSSQSEYRPFGKKARKVKQWDHTAFAKTGWNIGKRKTKKRKTKACADDSEVDGSDEEFEQFPAPKSKYSFSPPPPFKHTPDLLAAQTWIYPTNKSKRDYQFNIVKDSLFENTLVSLPTGLGKTFIAGVIMLNYYRWFPEGKVVFVAPTKPLVAQQIDACHQICGIPGGDAAELTGQVSPANRAKAWAEKRVFFMTPQTLMNDLSSETCNPTDIVLLVIDEAHKGSGEYAYAQVVRYLMATNGHFRLLALTATPGGKPEAVQDIIDALHISHIEIRHEFSIDLKGYILPKKISTHTIEMTPDIIKVRDMLAKLMEKTASPLIKAKIVPESLNVVKMHPFFCTAMMQELHTRGTGKKFPWAWDALKKLGTLARIMGYLLECSIKMCNDEIHGLCPESKQDEKKTAKLRSDPLFKDILKELERQHNTGFSLHPKLDTLQSMVINYFAQASADASEAATRAGTIETDGAETSNESKMMVFTNFRSSVDEIVELLNTHSPLVRATRFIGQGSDKRGKKGISQKDQIEVISQFKRGVYNVLVATSIGEEGLDIGEIDMIICYDAQKTPIRMLQRVGRTGRKRAGRVEVLLAAGREDDNWDKAKRDYQEVQEVISRGERLELYADVERLLPAHIKPRCLELDMTIEEYVREKKVSKASTTGPKGTKRKRNDDVMRNIPEGAVNGFIASSKLISKGDSKRRKVAPREPDSGEIQDDDDQVIESGIHGSPLSGPVDKRKTKVEAKAKPVKKSAATKPRVGKSTSTTANKMSLSQLDRKIEDDSDDMEIELGISLSPRRPLIVKKPSPPVSLNHIRASPSPERPNVDAIATCSSTVYPLGESNSSEDCSWLLGCEDDDDDVEVIEHISGSIASGLSSTMDHRSPKTPKSTPIFKRSPLSHVPSEKQREGKSMHPPIPLSSDAAPSSTCPIRPPGIRRKKVPVLSSSSPMMAKNVQVSSPAPSPPHRAKRPKVSTNPRVVREMLDLEAEVSGDETVDSSDHDDDVESESDRRFVQELAATQASPSYDQTMAYRQGLLTQAPNHVGPQFVSKPVRRGAFGPIRNRLGITMSSSPVNRECSDQYSMDSFVVEDDDDVLIEDSHSSSL